MITNKHINTNKKLKKQNIIVYKKLNTIVDKTINTNKKTKKPNIIIKKISKVGKKLKNKIIKA